MSFKLPSKNNLLDKNELNSSMSSRNLTSTPIGLDSVKQKLSNTSLNSLLFDESITSDPSNYKPQTQKALLETYYLQSTLIRFVSRETVKISENDMIISLKSKEKKLIQSIESVSEAQKRKILHRNNQQKKLAIKDCSDLMATVSNFNDYALKILEILDPFVNLIHLNKNGKFNTDSFYSLMDKISHLKENIPNYTAGSLNNLDKVLENISLCKSYNEKISTTFLCLENEMKAITRALIHLTAISLINN